MFAALLKELRHKSRPTGLVAGTDPRSVVTVEILVEKEMVPPIRVFLELFGSTENGPATVRAPEKDAHETMRKLRGHFAERHHVTRTRRAFHFEIVVQVM